MNWITGSMIGVVLGFISSFGFMAMNVKLNQRSALFPIIAVLTTTFGAIAGGRIGYNLEYSEKIGKALGLDKLNYEHYKIGRFWESKTRWTDIKGDKHLLKTFKASNNIVSYYNRTLLLNHGSSASSVNISKYHNEARNKVFKKLKGKYSEEYIKLLNNIEKT